MDLLSQSEFAVMLPSVIHVASMLANQVGSQSVQLQAEFKPMTDFLGQTLPKGATVGCRISQPHQYAWPDLTVKMLLDRMHIDV